MSFNPERLYCKSCGGLGCLSHDCPSCPCVYCKSEGYIYIFNTYPQRTRLWCQDRQEKGHRIGDQTFCQRKRRLNTPVLHSSNPTNRARSSVLKSRVPFATNILAQIDTRNQIREYQSIGRRDEAFPNINAITSHLLGILQVTTDRDGVQQKDGYCGGGNYHIYIYILRTITERIEPESLDYKRNASAILR